MAFTIDTIRRRVGAGRPLAITVVAIVFAFAVIFAWRTARQPAASADLSTPVPATVMTVSAGMSSPHRVVRVVS